MERRTIPYWDIVKDTRGFPLHSIQWQQKKKKILIFFSLSFVEPTKIKKKSRESERHNQKNEQKKTIIRWGWEGERKKGKERKKERKTKKMVEFRIVERTRVDCAAEWHRHPIS